MLKCAGSLAAILGWTFLSSASGAVDHVAIISRAVVLGGRAFGASGSYEKIRGRVYYTVKPDELHNRGIVDLDKAPTNARGEVEFSADLWLMRPVTMGKGNGAVLLEIPNRGRLYGIHLIDGGSGDPEKEGDFGDGWLLREGYTVAVLGWEWDLVDDPYIFRLHAPVVRGPEGHSIEGILRDDFTLSKKVYTVPLGQLLLNQVGGIEYPVSDPTDARNVLTVRERPEVLRREIPRADWSFSDESKAKGVSASGADIILDNRHLHLNSGFEPGKIYELVYTVRDPVVAGLGLAAVRDFISYLKYQENEVAHVSWAYGYGVSQSGRFLRHYVYQGFNADERGRQVFDGLLPNVAGAGRGSFNHRFAQPSRDASPMSALFFPTDIFPFTDLPESDQVTQQTAGLLDQVATARVVPKIFYSNTSYEYWSRAASLIHTSLDGREDAAVPATTRIYFFTGQEHFTGPFPPSREIDPDLQIQNLANPNPIQWLWRAMVFNMNAWVRDGVLPPASAYPKITDGTLVPVNQVRFPKLKGVNFPRDTSLAYRENYGPEWDHGIISFHPPHTGAAYTVLVPQVDLDGNEIAGVRTPEIRVPLGTYTGWNLRAPSVGAAEQRAAFLGSYFPLPATEDAANKTGDPRKSIRSRYRDENEYLNRFKTVADTMVQERWLLKEDLPAVMKHGKKEWEFSEHADGG